MWFWTAGSVGTRAMVPESSGMGHLVHVRYQKRVRIQVRVDSDLEVSVGVNAEIAEPGPSGSDDP